KGDLRETLTPTQCKNLLVAFSNAMDQAYIIRPFERGWVNSLWDRAERLIPVLLPRLDDGERQPTLEAMFGNGKAISWLTTLLRRETFAHGRYGSQRRPEAAWLFSDAELDRLRDIIVRRYRSMPASEVFSGIDPLNLLFAWRQSGDEDGPRR